MKTIKVLGQSDESLKRVSYGTELENFTVSDAVQFATNRASAEYQYISGLEDDDIVELNFEGDIRRWVKVSELQADYKYSLSRGDAEEGVIEIPAQLPTLISAEKQTTRGATAWALKALRVIKFDPVQKAANVLAEKWDRKLMPKPGLYRLSDGLLKGIPVDDIHDADPKKPILLFLHGTFSSTMGSFGKLPGDIWDRLRKHYGNQIFGFDHCTLSESPIQNALELVRKLPDNAKLHIVTHSRGGLIGELLSRRARADGKDPFDQDDLALAADHVQERDGEKDLVLLSHLLKSKDIRVERFVRIACPARGTTLASGRIDRWLELIVNVMTKVLDATPVAILGVLTDLLLDLKKQATNPTGMPGLAAMVPESGFIRMINRPDVEVNNDLCVIAGDVEKNDVLGRLSIFFADLFYFEDHDLVVQTRAMYGGAPRRNGLYFFHKGTDVNHFHYFSSRRTAEKIAEALTFSDGSLSDKGFRPLADAYKGQAIPEIELVARSYQKRANLSQPVVYVVPGIMGTHLSEGQNRIWLNLLELAQGRITNLQITNRNIRPHALVNMAYGNLVEYLSATHEVIPFPFDWRTSILEEAERFAELIQSKLDETDATKQPVRILAHSMGGLVTRAMINLYPEVWDQICARKGSRFIMLGTPNRGAHKIPRLILGRESTLRSLAMLDIRNPRIRLLEVIARFPGVLQILPVDDTVWNFLDDVTWDRFPNVGRNRWIKPLQKDLDEAKRFQEVLSRRTISAEDPIAYVAGVDNGAPSAMDIADNGDVIFKGTNEGDGTVTWRSGVLPEFAGRTWYMNASHGNMANHRESFAAIYDLLQDGKTSRLATAPPKVMRGVEEMYILQDKPVEIYPVQEDIEQIILGAQPGPLAEPVVQTVRVTVAHGNLAFCSNPVAAGHYEGDNIVSAERALDHHLNGRLSERHRLGLYPGPEGTAEVILNEIDHKPGGAIIVGLGKAGELSPRKLTQSFANGLREYAVKVIERKMLRGETEMTVRDEELSVSTLLIGAGGMGLSVAGSVEAILSGVIQANRSFAQMSGPLQSVRIAEIQFVDLYKDQAILAARALRNYTNKPELEVDPLLRTLSGGFQRLAYEESPGWWKRISVRAGTNNSLIFTLPTERARSEESQQDVQRRTINGLVSQAVNSPKWDQSLGTSMFELMIPNTLKSSFRDLTNILFVVDPVAAQYPWELLHDRRTGQDLPLVVQYGMVRQFTTSSFQERVIDVNNKNILVVGNPANMPKGFADLPGAQQEASVVAAKFTDFGYNVTAEIHSGSNSIMNSLFSNDYRILHLAGHGVYRHRIQDSEEERPEFYTGMVLGEDIYLTANEIKNKTEIPELVFINCCHLGRIDNPAEATRYPFNEFAASLSEKLIDMGVKAVIAAGWAVDDAAAITFADVFYDNILKGATFGDAIKEARMETYRLHSDRTNTWAAYQCYGDPAYRLVLPRDQARRSVGMFVDLDEAVLEIRNLSGEAKTASAAGLAMLQEKLLVLTKKIEADCQDWLKESSLCEALGDAFGEVFLFEQAMENYARAIQNERCGASIKAVEQLSNIRIRLAAKACEADPANYEKYKRSIESEIKTLKSLMRTVGETPERLAMVGSGYKRLAQIACRTAPADCDQALQKMEEFYEKAWDKDAERTYPLANYLVARLALLLRSNDPEAMRAALDEVEARADQAAALARQEMLKSPEDFWASIGSTDAALIGHMVNYARKNAKGLSDELSDELGREYRATWKRYGSARELRSVIEHYAFLVTVLSGEGDKNSDLSRFLERIAGTLNSIPQ